MSEPSLSQTHRRPMSRKLLLGLLFGLSAMLATAQSAQAQGQPYASDDYAMCARDDYTVISVLQNDYPMGMDSLDPTSVEIIDQPQSAVCLVDEFTGEVNYVPNEGYHGYDTFSYRVKSTNGEWSNKAWVMVEVWFFNQAPEIRDFTAIPLTAGSWNITGRLVDDEPVANRTITIRMEFTEFTTVTVTTDAQGNFSHLHVGDSSDWGWVYAKAIDSYGAESAEAMAYCFPVF